MTGICAGSTPSAAMLGRRGLHASTGGDSPGNGGACEEGQQIARPRKWMHRALPGEPSIGFGVILPKPGQTLLRDIQVSLAQQDVGEQATAHADLAVDLPYRQVNAFPIQCFLPCQHMLVNAVDQGAIKIEEKGG